MNRTKCLFCTVTALVVCGLSFASVARSEVIAARFTGYGQARHHVCSPGDCDILACQYKFRSVIIGNTELINLATGNYLGTPIPANLKLVVADQCEEVPRLVVWDSNTSNVIATVARLDSAGEINNVHVDENDTCLWRTTRAIKLLSIEFDAVGSETNSISSGSLSLFADQGLSDVPWFTEGGGCISNMVSTGVGQMTIAISDPGQVYPRDVFFLFRRVTLRLKYSMNGAHREPR